jgi:hypothetical protein
MECLTNGYRASGIQYRNGPSGDSFGPWRKFLESWGRERILTPEFETKKNSLLVARTHLSLAILTQQRYHLSCAREYQSQA